MSDLFGNHIVGFSTRWLNYVRIVQSVVDEPDILAGIESSVKDGKPVSQGKFLFDRTIS